MKATENYRSLLKLKYPFKSEKQIDEIIDDIKYYINEFSDKEMYEFLKIYNKDKLVSNVNVELIIRIKEKDCQLRYSNIFEGTYIDPVQDALKYIDNKFKVKHFGFIQISDFFRVMITLDSYFK